MQPIYDGSQLGDLVRASLIIDARMGGLVVGRSHAAGNIYVLGFEHADLFLLLSVEGGEYLINAYSAEKYRERLSEINADCEPFEWKLTLQVTDNTIIYNTHLDGMDRVLLMENGQFVVNKYATARHYAELETINRDIDEGSMNLVVYEKLQTLAEFVLASMRYESDRLD